MMKPNKSRSYDKKYRPYYGKELKKNQFANMRLPISKYYADEYDNRYCPGDDYDVEEGDYRPDLYYNLSHHRSIRPGHPSRDWRRQENFFERNREYAQSQVQSQARIKIREAFR